MYIALCKDATYYTGMTWNLANRDEQHRSGKGGRYTAEHGYVRMVYWEEFDDPSTGSGQVFGMARARERQIKKWSQEKKMKLIGGWWGRDWDEKERKRRALASSMRSSSSTGAKRSGEDGSGKA